MKAIFYFAVCTIVGDERDELGVRFLSHLRSPARWRCRVRRPLKGCPEILTFREIGSPLSLTPSFLIWRVAIPFASDAPAAATKSTSASPRPMIFCFSRVTLAQVATLCVPCFFDSSLASVREHSNLFAHASVLKDLAPLSLALQISTESSQHFVRRLCQGFDILSLNSFKANVVSAVLTEGQTSGQLEICICGIVLDATTRNSQRFEHALGFHFLPPLPLNPPTSPIQRLSPFTAWTSSCPRIKLEVLLS